MKSKKVILAVGLGIVLGVALTLISFFAINTWTGTKQSTNDNHIHDYNKQVVAPTCTENGYTTYICKNCGDTYVSDYIVALGHNYENDVCTRCGAKRSTEGLVFTLNEAGTEYSVTGYKGTVTKVIIVSTHNGLPVISIGDYAFSRCSSLTSVEIPSSVTSIGDGVFYECYSLTSITVDENNQNYKSIDDNLYSKDGKTLIQCAIGKTATSFSIPDGVTSIGEGAFYYCNSLTRIEIPNSVMSIGGHAFSCCSNLTSVTFGENSQLTSIGSSAFEGCSRLTSIEIPLSVTSIGSSAFRNCSSLTSIEIPSSVTSIGSAFEYCSRLTSITVDVNNQNYKSIDGNLYSKDGKSLIQYAIGKTATSFLIPDGVTFIGGSAFYYCSSLASIEIPSSVTSIGSYAFYYCDSLKSIEIPSNVISIDSYAFAYCSSLKSIEIPSSVTSIGNWAFAYCDSLKSIEIPSSVTSIGDYAFYCCSSLTSIKISSSVTSIGDSAFYCCSRLTSITVEVNNQNYKSIDGNLYSKDGKTLIQYAIGNTATSFSMPDGVTSIGDDSFAYCSRLTSIEIPSSVTSIGNYAFWYCSSLTSIEIPSSVTSIGDDAFTSCSELTNVTFGENSQLTSIGEGAFQSCSSLTSIEIPSSVTSIGEWAFYNCSKLTSIEIPSSVTSIGRCAFECFSSLTSATFKNTSGWKVSQSRYMSDATSLSSSDLSDVLTASIFLTSTYKFYYWERT